MIGWRTFPDSTVRQSEHSILPPSLRAPRGWTCGWPLLHLWVLGYLLATLLGADPKRLLDQDLVRLKSLIEYGRASAHGQEPALLARLGGCVNVVLHSSVEKR